VKFIFAVCAGVCLWTPSISRAQVFDPCCPIPFVVAYEMRTVTCYRPEWREEKVPCVVQRVSYRRDVVQVPCSTWVPQWSDQQVRTSYYVPVPKVVERAVPRCVMVPVTMCDPCTGCCFVQYCPQWIVQRVQCTEYDYRVAERTDVVKVCKMVEQRTVVEQVCWTPVVTAEQSWTTRCYCVMVPYQSQVCVPVWVPCR
jgi:hypothetical protein